MRPTVSRPGMRSFITISLPIVLLLLFLIPLGMIRSLVSERESLAQTAAGEIISGAGGSLFFVGPLFVVPYQIRETDARGIARLKSRELLVLPDTLKVEGSLNAEYRSRGIYRTPVYTADLRMSGSFSMPPSEAFPDGATVRNTDIRMVSGIRDMRGIRQATNLVWNGAEHAFGPDTGLGAIGSGIAAGPLTAGKDPVDFSWRLEVGGGATVSIAPLGRDSELLLAGDWPSPSFGGSRLPDERLWDQSGFEARWRIPEMSRPIRPYWDAQDEEAGSLVVETFDVELLEPVGTYARTLRSVKYGVIFLLIPFVVFFLFERIGSLRIHPVQYLLAGAADILFYLLLLAISEHWGFDMAYLTASGAVTLLLGFYTINVTRRRGFSGLVMPVVMAAAYTWLWVSLQSEDYALLIGSIGLFVVVALVMIFTRKVNWYAEDPGLEGQKGERGRLEAPPTQGGSEDNNREE